MGFREGRGRFSSLFESWIPGPFRRRWNGSLTRNGRPMVANSTQTAEKRIRRPTCIIFFRRADMNGRGLFSLRAFICQWLPPPKGPIFPLVEILSTSRAESFGSVVWSFNFLQVWQNMRFFPLTRGPSRWCVSPPCPSGVSVNRSLLSNLKD